MATRSTDDGDNTNWLFDSDGDGLGDFAEIAYGYDPDDPDTVSDFWDPNVRPYRRDSFILMAPGIDREWFTEDDLVNFTK